MIKSTKIVSKSLLSRCLPYDTQDELSNHIASFMQIDRDLILKQIIESSLLSLTTNPGDLEEKCALKILVHLTVLKPFVPADSREM